MITTLQQREQFEREGFLIFDPEISTALIEAIRADLHDKYLKTPGEPRTNERILNAWKTSPNVRALARSPKVLALLEEVYGRKALPFQTLNFPIGTQQKAHQDTIHFNSVPSGYMCGVWVALEDIDTTNGPLVYYPGSHKLPEFTMKDAGLKADYADYPKYVQFIAKVIDQSAFKPQYGTLQKGQALLWAGNLLHGGAFQKDKSRSRHSQVTHYFFEGCKYMTPMSSDEKRICWREPEWIT